MRCLRKIAYMKNTVLLLLSFLSAPVFGGQKATITEYNGHPRLFDDSNSAPSATYEVEMQKLPDGALRVCIPSDKIGSDVSFLEIAADFARAEKGERGFYVFPDGRLGHFNTDNGRIDGRTHTVVRNGKTVLWPFPYSVMPVMGMKTERATFVAIVKGFALESSPAVYAKNGKYQMFHRFYPKEAGGAYEDIVIDYYFLPENAGYPEMAKVYRNYQLERGAVKPLRERVKSSPTLKYTAESIFVRVKHGYKALNTQRDKMVEVQTPENEPPIKVDITFDRFAEIMRKMKLAGIDRAEVCSVGGTAGGFDGRFPDVLPIPEEFGGEQKYKEAVAFGKSLGYQMTVHFATSCIYQISKEWNPDFVCVQQDGSLLKQQISAGGRVYRLCPRVYLDHFIKRDWQTFRDLGFKGTHHIDVLSCIMPYRCFSKTHPLNSKESAACMNEIARYSREVFGSFGSEGSFDWLAPNLDFVLYTSFYPRSAERKEMVDKYVPFWQLVYHGIIVSNPYYATIDPTIMRNDRLSDDKKFYSWLKTPERQMLKVVEFGGRPVFYYTLYKDIAPLKKAYDIYEELKYLQYEFMEEHRELAPDVYLTRYSNGDETVCNYSATPFAYKSKTTAPLSYTLYKSEKQ